MSLYLHVNGAVRYGCCTTVGTEIQPHLSTLASQSTSMERLLCRHVVKRGADLVLSLSHVQRIREMKETD